MLHLHIILLTFALGNPSASNRQSPPDAGVGSGLRIGGPGRGNQWRQRRLTEPTPQVPGCSHPSLHSEAPSLSGKLTEHLAFGSFVQPHKLSHPAHPHKLSSAPPQGRPGSRPWAGGLSGLARPGGPRAPSRAGHRRRRRWRRQRQRQRRLGDAAAGQRWTKGCAWLIVHVCPR